jgi:hypothetical protein
MDDRHEDAHTMPGRSRLRILRLRSRKDRTSVAEDADALIASFGECAYELARTRARQARLHPDSDPHRLRGHWDRVRNEIGRPLGPTFEIGHRHPLPSTVKARAGCRARRERPRPSALDAGLLAAAQAVEHYEISGYGASQKRGRPAATSADQWDCRILVD